MVRVCLSHLTALSEDPVASQSLSAVPQALTPPSPPPADRVAPLGEKRTQVAPAPWNPSSCFSSCSVVTSCSDDFITDTPPPDKPTAMRDASGEYDTDKAGDLCRQTAM